MALSQIQCLDDNHVNPRVHESKPEFLYCEDQRLALEALLQDGREAFFKYLETRGLRAFLSDPELETLAGSVEPYDPGSDLFPASADVDEPPLSLQYWPELSDTSIPQLDLGWPDCDAYRGVTRTTVYSQPPQDGQAHIKEIVRKMIAQAQKVIAVVMDIFTDVDIFRDLLDAGFKRRVSVYILVERTTLPHFLSMCQRANMHAGHLKNLRVRCTDGGGFYTRSSTKVRGRMGHRFMFIDGDKAVSGSYSFTWMSSRLDRNLITVITGQTVDTFDRLFQSLYVTSSSVNLRQVATEVEPEPELLPQPVSVAAPSAAIARKLYNPKYALVALGNPSPTPSDGNSSSKDAQNPDTSKNPGVPETKKGRQKRAVKEAPEEAPPIHPGLTNLEKACLISYLPTWPEPDPPSDVIGFINIRDTSKPAQVHLQRSEMFGTSQAIRFSSPITMPKETLPEVALPRQLTAKRQEANNLQPAQQKNKESAVSKAQPAQLNTGDIRSKAEAPEKNSPASGPKCESNKDTTKPVDAENKQRSNTPTNQGAGHATTPHLSAHTPPQSSSKASTPNTRQPSHTTNNPKPDSLHGSNTTKKAELSSNAHSGVEHRTHILESDSTQTSQLCAPTDSNTEQHTQTRMVLPRTDSHTKLQNSSKITPNTQTPTVNSHVSSSSSTSALCSQSISPTSLSTSKITSAPLSSGSSSSLLSPRTSSSTTLNPPLTSSLTSSSLPSTPPVPKPRTVQLVIKDGVTSDGRKLPEISVVKNPPVATVMPTTVKKVPANFAEMNKQAQKNADNKGNIEEAPRQKQSGTSLETKKEEAVRDDRAGKQLVAGAKLLAKSDVLITDAPKGDGVSIQEIIPKDVEPKTLTSLGCKLTPQTDRVATVQTETKAPERVPADRELAEVPDEKSSAAQSKTYHARAQDAQRISYCELTPQDIGVLKVVDSPVSAPHSPHVSKDGTADSTHTSPNPKLTPVSSTDSTLKYDTHGAIPELTPKRNPEKPLRLHLSDSHVPDLCSPTPERESRSLTALARTPTPDGLFPRTPTPDSRTHTPDPRSYTPDFRTPTPDISDGYASPRTDSTLSTTSEEYYECRGSPYQEPVCERASYRNHEVAEDHVSPTHTNTTTAAPACINYNAHAATTEGNTSSSETGPARSSSSPSLLEKKVKMREEETTNEENGREEDDKGRELNAAERATEGDSRGTKRGDGNEAKRTADPFKESKDLTETAEKNKDAQAPKRKKVLNQSAAERLVDGGVTRGESTNEGAEPKRLSTADLKPKKFPSEGERADKEKTGDGTALGPSVVLRRDKPEAAGETEGQKITLLRPPQGQQQTRVSSPSRPARPPQPLSPSQAYGPRPWGNKVLQSNFPALDNTSSPRRPPSRPPPPLATGAVGSGLGQKQVEISPSQQNLLSRQALAAAQGKTRAGQTLNQQPYPKPQASLLHTQSNMQSHLQNQTVSAHEAHSPEEGRAPFGVTFSRLYNLKGLKDKVSKLPMQSKRGSASSAAEGRKSTS